MFKMFKKITVVALIALLVMAAGTVFLLAGGTARAADGDPIQVSGTVTCGGQGVEGLTVDAYDVDNLIPLGFIDGMYDVNAEAMTASDGTFTFLEDTNNGNNNHPLLEGHHYKIVAMSQPMNGGGGGNYSYMWWGSSHSETYAGADEYVVASSPSSVDVQVTAATVGISGHVTGPSNAMAIMAVSVDPSGIPVGFGLVMGSSGDYTAGGVYADAQYKIVYAVIDSGNGNPSEFEFYGGDSFANATLLAGNASGIDYVFPPTSSSADQIVEGNVASAIAVTNLKDHTGLTWTVGGANVDTQTNALNIKSNVAYDISVKADGSPLREWNGSGYVTSGLVLQTKIQAKLGSDSFADVNTTDSTFRTGEFSTGDSGTNYDDSVKQHIDYGDTRALNGDSYHGVFTWTATSTL